MPKMSLRERLQQSKPLLADGAMGTLLHERGELDHYECFDELNLTQPELVSGIHRDYAVAGSDLLETNSFGANRYKLAERNLQNRVAEVNAAAVRLAREGSTAAGRADEIYIAGSVGPLGAGLRPYGRISREDAREAFAEQIGALAAEGVDALILETFSDHEELIVAVEAARHAAPELPIIAQVTFSPEGLTTTGYGPARVANDLYLAGVDVIGVNCGTGPQHNAAILQSMHEAVPGGAFSAMPNAGFPEAVGGRVVYPARAAYFGDYALVARQIGAQIIGGCCGTTPQHIAAMRAALDNPAPAAPRFQVLQPRQSEADAVAARPTHLAERLADGRFTITVEMTPPRGYAVEELLTQARLLRDAGSDLIDVADTPAAKMKMSAWAVSHLLQDRVGIETVLHFPTRGRNLLRVQGDLLAAHALGLRNLFVTMGDPVKIGDYPDASDGYDIVPSRLIELIKQGFNAGVDMAGNSIGQPTSFLVGCALNMAADNLEQELKVLDKKLSAGADFALGQVVFDPPRIDRFLEAYYQRNGHNFNLPVIMGVIPLHSLRQALFLHNEVPGIVIPDEIFKRLEDAGDDAPQEGVRIAGELMAQMRDKVQGAYIIASGRYHQAAEVCDAIASLPTT